MKQSNRPYDPSTTVPHSTSHRIHASTLTALAPFTVHTLPYTHPMFFHTPPHTHTHTHTHVHTHTLTQTHSVSPNPHTHIHIWGLIKVLYSLHTQRMLHPHIQFMLSCTALNALSHHTHIDCKPHATSQCIHTYTLTAVTPLTALLSATDTVLSNTPSPCSPTHRAHALSIHSNHAPSCIYSMLSHTNSPCCKQRTLWSG